MTGNERRFFSIFFIISNFLNFFGEKMTIEKNGLKKKDQRKKWPFETKNLEKNVLKKNINYYI